MCFFSLSDVTLIQVIILIILLIYMYSLTIIFFDFTIDGQIVGTNYILIKNIHLIHRYFIIYAFDVILGYRNQYNIISIQIIIKKFVLEFKWNINYIHVFVITTEIRSLLFIAIDISPKKQFKKYYKNVIIINFILMDCS